MCIHDQNIIIRSLFSLFGENSRALLVVQIGWWCSIFYNYPPRGRCIVVDILFTDPEGVFVLVFTKSVAGWKWKQVTFCKLKTPLSRNYFLTIYKHLGDFVKCIFTILLQIQQENNFLPTWVNTDKPKVVASLAVGICLYDCFICRSGVVILTWLISWVLFSVCGTFRMCSNFTG